MTTSELALIASTTGSTRSISSATDTSGVSGENGRPPTSTQSAPSSTARSACSTARSSANVAPRSKKESGVRLTTAITAQRRAKSKVRAPMRRGVRAATAGGTVVTGAACRSREPGQAALEVAHRLPDPLLVLDEREAHEPLAARAEADTRRDRDVARVHQVRRELDRVHVVVGLGDPRPREHRAARLEDVPPDALQALV